MRLLRFDVYIIYFLIHDKVNRAHSTTSESRDTGGDDHSLMILGDFIWVIRTLGITGVHDNQFVGFSFSSLLKQYKAIHCT